MLLEFKSTIKSYTCQKVRKILFTNKKKNKPCNISFNIVQYIFVHFWTPLKTKLEFIMHILLTYRHVSLPYKQTQEAFGSYLSKICIRRRNRTRRYVHFNFPNIRGYIGVCVCATTISGRNAGTLEEGRLP